jgi:glycosyltransferase involved in cell wall biosynthesis
MAPYRFPLFREISKNSEIDLTVYFMSHSAKNRRWKAQPEKLGFKYEVLPKIEINFFGRDLFTYIINYTFPIKYFKRDFDVVISAGWLDFVSQVGFLLCKLTNKKFIIWSESTINEPSWRRTIMLPFVRFLVRYSDACIAIGTRSKEYLLKLGSIPEKIFVGYSTVDVDLFKTKSKFFKKERKAIRKKLGIKTSRVVLYVGQFIERKGLIHLLKAFEELVKTYKDVSLLLVGYGPLKEKLIDYVEVNDLHNVIFKSHIEVQKMPQVYSASDLFVLPSIEETWGLVINEAMACGLPIITTEKVGSSIDLVKNNYNGSVVSEGDYLSLYQGILKIITDTKTINTMSKNSGELILNFTPKIAARSFVKAVKYALEK